jgi:hypothetical protein
VFDHATLVAFAAVVFAFHAAVPWLARCRAGPAGDERPDRLEDGRLRCPGCGAVNESAFQFYRECVGELQDSAPTVPPRPSSGGSLFR